jgi:hypothetical protein
MRITFVFLIFSCFQLHAQSFDFLKGQHLSTTDKFVHEPKNKFNIEALDTLIHISTSGGMHGGQDFYIKCLRFSDSSYSKNVIILVTNDTTHYTIQDILVIDNIPKRSYIQIGSREFDIKDEVYHTRYVVALEFYNGRKIHDPSRKIYKAWTNLDGEMTFTELDPKSIKRIHEGYYKKDDLPKKKRK